MDGYKELNDDILKSMMGENKDLRENNEWMAKRIIKLEGDIAQTHLEARELAAERNSQMNEVLWNSPNFDMPMIGITDDDR